MGEGQLHLVLVGVADADLAGLRPDGAATVFPLFDDAGVGRQDALPDEREGAAAPVAQRDDQGVDLRRGGGLGGWVRGQDLNL